MSLNFESFNKGFFSSNKTYSVEWFDRKGVCHINKDIIAEITLVTHGRSGHYEGYSVRVINNTGELTSHYFGFSTYLKKRSDNRSDWSGDFHINSGCCDGDIVKWYIAIPIKEEIKEMVKKIIDFISHYNGLCNND